MADSCIAPLVATFSYASVFGAKSPREEVRAGNGVWAVIVSSFEYDDSVVFTLVNESKRTIKADITVAVTNSPAIDCIALSCDKGYTFEPGRSWAWTSATRRSAFVDALAGEDLCVQVDITAPTNAVSSIRSVWHYEGKERSVADGFRAIYDDPKTLAPDISLSLPRAAAVPAHKLVLIARSPVFRAMLTGPMKESTRRIIKIAHYEEDVVRAFLRFLYCDCCTATELDAHALGLLAMADEYDVPALLSVCEAYLSTHLTEQNMVHVVEAADMHHLPTLKRTALEYVARHAEVFTRKSAYFGEGVPEFMRHHARAGAQPPRAEVRGRAGRIIPR